MDYRNNLTLEIRWFITRSEPEAFVVENVPGFPDNNRFGSRRASGTYSQLSRAEV